MTENETIYETVKKSFAFMKKSGRMFPIERTKMNVGVVNLYVTHDGHNEDGVRHHIIEGSFGFTVARNAYCVSLEQYNKLTDADCVYTPEMAGSGQFGICGKCDKLPTKDGHDGCIGILPVKDVMNACCGHGCDSQAYVQFWDQSRISGSIAIKYIEENKQ